MILSRRKISLNAPAKINLFLHVLGKRADGYHDLVTWMQKLDLCDVIEIELAQTGRIDFSCNDQSLPVDNSNLAVRAANAFLAKSSILSGCGLRISLEKNIPVAAGLGGGSSDAGSVLQGLNQLAGEEFSAEQLVDLARPLGADVPFFAVEHQAVIARGIGDVLHPVDSMGNCSFVLVNPDFYVSTAYIFESLLLTSDPKNSKVPRFREHKVTSMALTDMHNDLEKVTCTKYPEIEQMKESLLKVGASKVLMSGSGPTVFGVFQDTEEPSGSRLEGIVDVLRQQYGTKVFLSRACTGA